MRAMSKNNKKTELKEACKNDDLTGFLGIFLVSNSMTKVQTVRMTSKLKLL